MGSAHPPRLSVSSKACCFRESRQHGDRSGSPSERILGDNLALPWVDARRGGDRANLRHIDLVTSVSAGELNYVAVYPKWHCELQRLIQAAGGSQNLLIVAVEYVGGRRRSFHSKRKGGFGHSIRSGRSKPLDPMALESDLQMSIEPNTASLGLHRSASAAQ